LGGEVGERGAAAGLGSDPEFAEAVAESGGGKGSAGLQSGEQPAGGAWGADSGVGAAGAGEGLDELGERFGDVQVVGSESEKDLRALSFDLVVGDRHDPGQVLAVEQQQCSGDPVGEFDGVVVQEPGDLGPPFVVVGGRAGVAARGWRW
jgi:hypothetical protein